MAPPPRLVFSLGDPAIERTFAQCMRQRGWNPAAAGESGPTLHVIDVRRGDAVTALDCGQGGNDCFGVVCLGDALRIEAGRPVLLMSLPFRMDDFCRMVERFWEKTWGDAPRRIGRSLVYTARIRSLAGRRTVELTAKEAHLFEMLEAAGPLGATREKLLEDIWGYAPGLETHTLETHIYRLRQKLEEAGTEGESWLKVEEGRYYLIVEKG